ncbi:MAG: DUF484 family protein [Proteobacteria bacterium]|jgi:hypothetical protein|nr:DUF484 family protein [Pseudomonadota bacterium]MCG6936015.1 DUF484 family protein [Pseudomonadota bacterium]
MSTRQKLHLDELDMEREVVRYLRDNPDFFERHLDLLADILLPHESGRAVSLVERQVSVLREQRDEQRNKLKLLIQTARKNETLNTHINALMLALLDATSLQEILEIIQTRLADDFDAETVVVRLFNTGHPYLAELPELVDWSEPVMGAFEKVINGRKPVCGALKPGQLDALFDDAAGQIHSAALVPLVANEEGGKCYGLLAIGSRDRNRFRADMGIVFLSQLGKVLSRVLKGQLEN